MKSNKEDINCNCSICRLKLPFEFPRELIHELTNDNVVLFAGAGISTEVREVFKFLLYEQVAEELEMEDENFSFPELMSKYCKQKNGRLRLLDKIRRRFDYAHQYPEIYNQATRFHREISPLWMLKTIVTTNWDDYFERECGAIPIVIAEDFAFHSLEGRKVYKIHGSINNYGSIVATTEDYKKCYKNLKTGLIGSFLKTILASKTIIFVGYSFRDFTFNKIYKFLQRELGDLLPHSYIVTLDDPSDSKFKNYNSTVIQTDATFFFSIIKEHMQENDIIPSDSFFDDLYSAKFILREIRDNFVLKNRNMVDFPALLYSVSYLDGMEHAFDYQIHHSKSGKAFNYKERIEMVDLYIDDFRKRFMKNRAYYDVSYIDGYINGLKHIVYHKFVNPEELPFLYIYGYGIIENKTEFNKAVKGLKNKHKSAYALAKEILKVSINNDKEIILRHRAFL